jgi:hypothetical protein
MHTQKNIPLICREYSRENSFKIDPREDSLQLREYDFKGMNSLQVISLKDKGLLRK